MLIVCPTCGTSYDVKAATLQPNGRRVRCVRCGEVWQAELTRAEKLTAAAAALGPKHSAPEVAFGRTEAAPATAGDRASGWNDFSVDVAPEGEPSLETPAEGLNRISGPAANDDPQSYESDEAADAAEAPPIVPVDLDAGRPPIDIEADHAAEPAAAKDIESFAARRLRRDARRRQWRWSMSYLQTAILVLVVLDCIVVGWRKDVVRVLPQTASLYALIGLPVNLRGLGFEDVTTTTEEHEGVPILVVEGNIVNRTGRVAEVPRLKIAVRNGAKQEIYSWTAVPSQASLGSGEALAFRTRLASPPPDSFDVLVRFVNRRDIIADGH